MAAPQILPYELKLQILQSCEHPFALVALASTSKTFQAIYKENEAWFIDRAACLIIGDDYLPAAIFIENSHKRSYKYNQLSFFSEHNTGRIQSRAGFYRKRAEAIVGDRSTESLKNALGAF